MARASSRVSDWNVPNLSPRLMRSPRISRSMSVLSLIHISLVSDGKLTIGTSAEYEPFEYMEDGEYKGFDLELAQAIADDLGLDLQIENVDFDTIVPLSLIHI